MRIGGGLDAAQQDALIAGHGGTDVSDIAAIGLHVVRVDASEVDAVLAAFSGKPFIFNLGHGILPETPIAHVEQMLARVRGVVNA